MRRIILLPLLLLCLVSKAQTTMQEVFKSMPDSLMPYLSVNNRLDFIDFIESSMEAKVTNGLGGKSVMTDLNNQYLCIQLNESSVVQMRLLPVSVPVDGMQQVVCMVQTYGTSGKESTISFYSCSWRPLSWPVAGLVSADDLLARPATMTEERFNELKAMLMPYLLCASLSADDDIITLSISNAQIPTDDQADVDAVRLSKTIKWNGHTFK